MSALQKNTDFNIPHCIILPTGGERHHYMQAERLTRGISKDQIDPAMLTKDKVIQSVKHKPSLIYVAG